MKQSLKTKMMNNRARFAGTILKMKIQLYLVSFFVCTYYFM